MAEEVMNAESSRRRPPLGRRFQPGNPGKQKGTRNATTRLLEALLDGEATAIMRKAVELAVAGDAMALRACLDRLLPPRRDRPVSFALPALDDVGDLPKASGALLKAVAAGELTPSEAAEIGKLVDAHIRAVELTDIEARLADLEEERS